MLEPSPLRDERVRLALHQLALARSLGEQVPIDRAESLVVSLLLPFALERTAVGNDPASVADVLRVTAARLTRAVMDTALTSTPEHTATLLIRAAVPRRVAAGPGDPGPTGRAAAPDRLPGPAVSSALPAVEQTRAG